MRRGRIPALPVSTIRSIRPGCSAAMTIPMRPPLEWPTRSHALDAETVEQCDAPGRVLVHRPRHVGLGGRAEAGQVGDDETCAPAAGRRGSVRTARTTHPTHGAGAAAFRCRGFPRAARGCSLVTSAMLGPVPARAGVQPGLPVSSHVSIDDVVASRSRWRAVAIATSRSSSIAKGHAGRLPQVERERARKGVQLVDEKGVTFGRHQEVDSGDAGRSDRTKGSHRSVLDAPGQRLGDRRGDHALRALHAGRGRLRTAFSLATAEIFVRVAERSRALRLLAHRHLDIVPPAEHRAVDLDDAVLRSLGEDRRVVPEREVERRIELLASFDA